MQHEHIYQPRDVIETRDGRQLLVVAVGEEAYLLRRLDWAEGESEPRESAWLIEGCEDATWLVRRGDIRQAGEA